MLYFNLLSSDIIKEGADSKYTCMSQKTLFTLGLTLFENLYSSCQHGVTSPNQCTVVVMVIVNGV